MFGVLRSPRPCRSRCVSSGVPTGKRPAGPTLAALLLATLAACGPGPAEPAPVDGGWPGRSGGEPTPGEGSGAGVPGTEPARLRPPPDTTAGHEAAEAPSPPPALVEPPSAREAEAAATATELEAPMDEGEPPLGSPPLGPPEAVASARENAAGTASPGSPRRPGASAEPVPPTMDSQSLGYEESRPKSVLELQPWRQASSTTFETAGREGVATLVNINPLVGAWWLLRLEWVGGGDPEVYHLENPFPAQQTLRLDPDSRTGLLLGAEGAEAASCDLWTGDPSALASARSAGRPFVDLCEARLYLRNPTAGRKTSKEWATDFLRDRVWGGERITTLVRDTVFRDSQRRRGRLSAGAPAAGPAEPGSPETPLLSQEAAGLRIEPRGLGLLLDREPGPLVAGRWYPVRGVPGVLVSAVRPDLVDPEIVETRKGLVSPLDPKETSALVYVVAFDLARFDLGFALGTDHPRVGWSERVRDEVRDDVLPGPDGIGTVAPLVRTGMLAPAEAVRVVATFAGGFKRSHGAFKYGALSLRNHGSHYGFIEEGAILSKLQPGLSTLLVRRDGRVTLETWSTELEAGLPEIRYARQNGVPLIERDPASGEGRPGDLLRQWGAGNWSGSSDRSLRTLRAGLGLQEGAQGSFLLYGFFTSATPSAMARVFEAYRCHDAMLLDMNALEHTYLAVYREEGTRRVVDRLIDEMAVLDKVVDGETVPRFVGFPDNRDFFFLLRRGGP